MLQIVLDNFKVQRRIEKSHMKWMSNQHKLPSCRYVDGKELNIPNLYYNTLDKEEG